MKTDSHEMVRVGNRVVPIYTDSSSNRYRIVDGGRQYGEWPDKSRSDWCVLCGRNHAEGDWTPGYSCEPK